MKQGSQPQVFEQRRVFLRCALVCITRCTSGRSNKVLWFVLHGVYAEHNHERDCVCKYVLTISRRWCDVIIAYWKHSLYIPIFSQLAKSHCKLVSRNRFKPTLYFQSLQDKDLIFKIGIIGFHVSMYVFTSKMRLCETSASISHYTYANIATHTCVCVAPSRTFRQNIIGSTCTFLFL